ncbi:FlhC family transcriptional regulator [Thorsellia kenyensis]|uniref:FlhC family transcriptional regulator n=1 Tax=Thorsellia kenyensis TaxID=1549888 RepID=A0ABV6CD96_9GAMM
MTKIQVYEKRFEALTLLRLGLSVSIVSKCSELPPSFVREMHKKLFLTASRSGPLKEVNGILKNTRVMIQASIILKNYISIGNNIFKEVDIDALIKAYDIYSDCFYRSQLDKDNLWQSISLNHAWQLCRGLISKEIKLRVCPKGCTYIESNNQNLKLQCQLCYLIKIELGRIKKRKRKRRLKLAE